MELVNYFIFRYQITDEKLFDAYLFESL